MRFENTEVFNFEGAIRGMRNPMNSWDKSDSYFGLIDLKYPQDAREEVVDAWVEQEVDCMNKNIKPYDREWEDLFDSYDSWLWDTGTLQWNKDDIVFVAHLGPKDLELAQKLVRAGNEHSKFMRQIGVSVDITAPIFWWKEMDTYKVGTTANSTSTMHKLTSREIGMGDFEFSMNPNLEITSYTMPHGGECGLVLADYQKDIVDMCETLRKKYVETNNKQYWRALIEILPESYLQTRTWTANYAVLRNIYIQRHNHRLKEWRDFCDWITNLPYGGELITIGE